MSLLALICALLLDKYRPLPWRIFFESFLSRFTQRLLDSFSTGQRQHGMVVWLLTICPIVALTVASYLLLHYVHPVLALLFNVVVLYHTLSLQPFSHQIELLKISLAKQQTELIGQQLSVWRGYNELPYAPEDQIRLACEYLLIASHRYVFSIMVWFVLFSLLGLGGAAGAVLYRFAQKTYQQWVELPSLKQDQTTVYSWDVFSTNTIPAEEHRLELAFNTTGQRSFGSFAQDAFNYLEWLPTRVAALTFAIVGNFEQTLRCWRTQATTWPDKTISVLLASGAGATGLKLGQDIHQNEVLIRRPPLGVGEEVDEDSLNSLWSLILRAISFLLILLLMMTLANLLG